MTSLLAARRENFAATLRFHADAEAVRLGAATFARLICALRQSNSPLVRGRNAAVNWCVREPMLQWRRQRKRRTVRADGLF